MNKRVVYGVIVLGILVLTGVYINTHILNRITKGNYPTLSKLMFMDDSSKLMFNTIIYDFDSIRQRFKIPTFSSDATLSQFTGDAVFIVEYAPSGAWHYATYFAPMKDPGLFYEIGQIENQSIQLVYVLGSLAKVDNVLFAKKKRSRKDYRFYDYFDASVSFKGYVDSTIDLSVTQFDSMAQRLMAE